MNSSNSRTRKALDVAATASPSVLTVPVQAATALAIRILLGSPVLFRHTRPSCCRPLKVLHYERHSPERAKRHGVRSGLTGPAQTSGRNAMCWDDKFTLDVHFVEHQSFVGDLKNLRGTVRSILRRDGIPEAGLTTCSDFLSNGQPKESP